MRTKTFNQKLAEKVLGAFSNKGLIYSPKVRPVKNAKLSIKDVIKVAEQFEPRIWEVLPAAIIHYPNMFLELEKLPIELSQIISCIEKDQPGLDYKGIKFVDMKRWAKRMPKDRRIKSLNEKKALRSFRLSLAARVKLKNSAKELNLSESAYLERLLG